MRLWARVRAQLFGDDRPEVDAPTGQPTNEPALPEVEATAEPAESGAESDPGAVEARQERAAGRILEDERLRGDLTDDEFQPLLDWALAVTDRVAASTSDLPDDQADARIDAAIQAIREVLSAAGAAIVAHNEGDADRRASELGFLAQEGIDSVYGLIPGLVAGNAAARLSALADSVSAQGDLGGSEVAARIASAMASDMRETGSGQ